MSITRRYMLVAGALALGFALAGTDAAAQSEWQAGGGQKWQDLLAAAKKEGKVVVAAAASFGDAVRKSFREDTGIEVVFLAGNPNELNSRFNTEARAANLSIDVLLGGAAQLPLIPTGILKPLRPMIVLPGSGDGPWYPDGKMKFDDKAGTYLYQGAELRSPPPIVNTDHVKPSELTAYAGLLNPKFKGKIASNDPRVGGPGLAVASYLAHKFGMDFVKKLYIGQEVKYTRNGHQLAEWAARGVHPIVLGTSQVEIQRFIEEGIKSLQALEMTDAPGTVSGGFSVAKVGTSAPNPNAAAVFINWYASRRGQQVYTDAMDEPSRRKDVDLRGAPAYIIPKHGVDYLDQYAEDFYMGERTRLQKAIAEALGGS